MGSSKPSNRGKVTAGMASAEKPARTRLGERLARSSFAMWWRADGSPAGLIVLGIAAAAFLGLRTFLPEDAIPELLMTVIRSVGEALLVGLVLALTVDSYLKRRAFQEVANGSFWALLNPEAHPVHRAAVEDSARAKTLYESMSWTVHFKWKADDVLALTLTSNQDGVSHEAHGYAPSGQRYLLPSTGGYESEHVAYHLTGTWVGEPRVRPVQLRQHDDSSAARDIAPYVVKDGDLVLLDEDRIREELVGQAYIEPGRTFNLQRTVRYYRPAAGFVPLVAVQPHLTVSFEPTGSAAEGLDVSILDVRNGKSTPLVEGSPTRYGYGPARATYILSWKPKAAGQSEPRDPTVAG